MNYIMIVMYCSFYVQSLILLMFQFVYKYITICRSTLLEVVHTSKILLCVILFYSSAVIAWAVVVHATLYVYPQELDYLNAALQEHFNVSVHDVPALGAKFESSEVDGVPYINWRPYIGMLFLNSMMSTFCSIMVFCGWKIYKTLQKLVKTEKTAKLQKELFKALLVQTFIPVVLEYLPCFIIYATAIFGLPVDLEFTCMLIALDPIIEPIAIVYFIKDYRFVVYRCFGFQPEHSAVSRHSNRINTLHTETSNQSYSRERNFENTVENSSNMKQPQPTA